MGGGPCAEAGDAGTDTGDHQVGRVTRAGAGVGAMTVLGLCTAVWGNGSGNGDRVQGGV